jgi:hypothetical protein
MKIAYTIHRRANGRFNLNKGTVTLCDFESKAAAEEGLHRVIHAEMYYYDENGDPINH